MEYYEYILEKISDNDDHLMLSFKDAGFRGILKDNLRIDEMKLIEDMIGQKIQVTTTDGFNSRIVKVTDNDQNIVYIEPANW